MKTLDTSKAATLNIATRKGVSLSFTVKNEAVTGATYQAKVYADDYEELLSLTVTTSGANLIVSHAQITIPTGVYRYTLERTVGSFTFRILEGNFIVQP